MIRGVRRGRVLAGAVLAVAGLAALTAGLVAVRESLSLASVALLYLVAVVAVGAVGGAWPALAAAVASDLLVNFFFTPPYHTLLVESRDNVITLVVYVGVAVTVSVAVDLAARQRAAAARTGIEAALLARVTAEPVAEGSLDALLTHVRDTFGMSAVALVEGGQVIARVGEPLTGTPVLEVPAAEGLHLVAEGPEVFAADQRFLGRLASAAARILEAQRLAGQAARARELAEIDRLRAALLAAVGHDLRTPLAGIKAAVSSLREPDLALTAAARAELLETIEESTDSLDALVENLLALSRLQAGVLSVQARPVALDAVAAAALLHAPVPDVKVDIPDDLPLVRADPGLLERVIANLVANAARYGPPVALSATAVDGRVSLHVVDHGPGVPEPDRERMFAPFQRLGDRTTGGLGMGLAIARGFTEAMGGTLTPADTPGGGLTMTVTLDVA